MSAIISASCQAETGENPTRETDLVDGIDQADWGDDVWTKYGNDNVYPLSVVFTPKESAKINPISTNMQDYANGMIAKFIMGKENT